MKKFTSILFFQIFIALFVVMYADASTRIDIFTDEEKMFLAEYQANDREKPIEETAIRGFILNKLQNGRDSQETLNGLFLIARLTDEHQTHFDNSIISLLEREIQTTQTYDVNRRENGTFTRGLYALGLTRTEISIEYLLKLVKNVENWPENIKNPVLANNDRDNWIFQIRKNAFDALFDPQDIQGVELFPVLEELVSTFPAGEFTEFLAERIEGWKELYRRKNISPSPKTQVSDFEVLEDQQ